MNHREILGVSASANKAEINDAFRKAAKENHPDHSNSPEAAEAFMRIKAARDALIENADKRTSANSIQNSTASAVRATTNQAFTPPPAKPAPTAEEIMHQQELDRQAAAKSVFSLFKFGRSKESAEVQRHRKRIKTNNRRLDGKY